MRSMLQLLGGVVVAGAVAAGATAFTASGVTPTATIGKNFLGGTVTQNIAGATIDSITWSFTDGTKTVVDGLTITLTDASAAGKTPLVSMTASPAYGGTITCASITTTSSACTIGTPYTLGSVTSLSITVA